MNKPMQKPNASGAIEGLGEAHQKTNAQEAAAPAFVTVVQSEVPEVLTKRFSLRNGSLKKEGGGVLVSGHATVRKIDSLTEFAALLTSLGPDQALIYGRPEADDIPLTTQADWQKSGRPDDVIPRTNETFFWPDGPGILMLDYDPPEGEVAMTPEELIVALKAAVPGLAQVEMLSWPSASSWIRNTDTDDWVREQSGQRLYLMVKDARDIPRAGQALFDRLWLAGHGYMKVSSSGSLLPRTPIDAMVWQASRLDFAAGAECDGPLVQDRGEPVQIAGDKQLLDSLKVLPDLAPHEQKAVEALKKQARAEKKDEAAAARTAWLDRQALKMVGDNAGADKIAAARDQAELILEGGPLSGDFVIEVESDRGIEDVTVAEILSAPERYDRAKTRDPLEPEYDGGRLVGMLFLDGPMKTLHSFARGGATYQLAGTVENIQVMAGQLARAVDATLDVLRDHPDVFDFGEELVLHDAGRLHVQTEHSLNQFLGSVIQYTKSDRHGKLSKIDPPPNLARRILALKAQRGLKPLSGVITAPTLRLDGSVLEKPGYDPATQLVYHRAEDGDHFDVPKTPTIDDCRAALETLWRPFAEFPFVDLVDRSVMLTALLTAAVRPVLPKAPAFAFDAPIQGAGKSLLAECVSALAGAAKPSVHPHTRDEDEIRKRLFAVLRSGVGAMVWDNVLGEFNSASMAALLTSSEYSDRVLGVSHSVTLPNRLLVAITGNNLVVAGDLPRRVLVARIDPQTDAPHARAFDLDPIAYVLENRQALIQAALTLMRGRFVSNADRPEGRMASFEDWNDVVRNTVAWIGRTIALGEWVDPMEAVTRGIANDPENDALSELLAALQENFGHEEFRSQEVMEKVARFRDPSGCGMAVADTPEFRLYEALITINEKAVKTTASLGKTLKYRKDRMVDGRVLRQGQDGHAKISVWRVAEVDDA
ncbi:MAG: hypothetical protein ACX93P_15340 [Roseovarius sp.]